MARMPDAAEDTKLGPVRALRAVFSGVGQLLLAADRFRAEEADRSGAEDVTGAVEDEGESSGSLDGEAAKPRVLKITGKAEPVPAGAKPGKSSPGKSAGKSAAQGGSGGATGGAKRTTRKSGGASTPPRFRSLDSTGNVRVLTEQDKADLAEDEMNRSLATETESETDVGLAPGLDDLASFPSYGAGAAAFAEPAALAEPELGGSIWAQSLPIADYDNLSLASLRARLRGLDPTQLRALADYEICHANRADVVTMFENRITKLHAES